MILFKFSRSFPWSRIYLHYLYASDGWTGLSWDHEQELGVKVEQRLMRKLLMLSKI